MQDLSHSYPVASCVVVTGLGGKPTPALALRRGFMVWTPQLELKMKFLEVF